MPLNVLVVDRGVPVSDSHGNDLIARQLFRRLRTGHRLTLVAPVLAGEEAAAGAAIDGLFDEIRLVPRDHRLTSLGGWVETAIGRSRLPLASRFDGGAAAGFAAEVRRIIAATPYDVIHVRQLPMAAHRPDLGTAPRLLELIDSEALASARATGGGLRRRIRRPAARMIERLAVRGFPIVTMVAEPDAEVIRGLARGGRVAVVPNGVDADRFRAAPDAVTEPDSVVFVGAMSFPPNVAAVSWFATEVMPRLRATRPTITFTIVGRDPTPGVLALAGGPGVTVTGSVDDVRPYLARAAVVVAPLVSGSGIKNKVLEAMAMARPIVATPLAVEGLAAVAERDIVVASGPAAFAAAVTALLDDPGRATAIGAAGRALVEAHYTWDACAAHYAALYAELAAGASTTR